jgi:hypothetical protein
MAGVSSVDLRQVGGRDLLRLELLGIDVGDRWIELADKAEKRIGDHVILFTVPHWMMALSAAAS